MVGELGCHGRAAMSHLPFVLALQAPMCVTAIVQSDCEPPHPPVLSSRFGKGQRLTPLALVAQAAGPVVPCHHTRVALRVAQEREPMRPTRCAMPCSHLSPHNALAC